MLYFLKVYINWNTCRKYLKKKKKYIFIYNHAFVYYEGKKIDTYFTGNESISLISLVFKIVNPSTT